MLPKCHKKILILTKKINSRSFFFKNSSFIVPLENQLLFVYKQTRRTQKSHKNLEISFKMKFCYFPLCSKTTRPVFIAPNDPEVRDEWIKFIKEHKKKFKDTASFSLCEIHFNVEDIIDGKARKMLKKGSVPTQTGVSFLNF